MKCIKNSFDKKITDGGTIRTTRCSKIAVEGHFGCDEKNRGIYGRLPGTHNGRSHYGTIEGSSMETSDQSVWQTESQPSHETAKIEWDPAFGWGLKLMNCFDGRHHANEMHVRYSECNRGDPNSPPCPAESDTLNPFVYARPDYTDSNEQSPTITCVEFM
jgi:hypothetical protein